MDHVKIINGEITTHRNHLVRKATVFSGGKHYSEDVVHDLFCKMLENANAGNVPDCTIAYMQVAVRNRIRDQIKKERTNTKIRISQTDLEDGLTKEGYVLSKITNEISLYADSPSPEDGLMERDRPRILRRFLESADPEIKQIIYLRFTKGLKLKEIGKIMDMDLRRVAERISAFTKSVASFITKNEALPELKK